MSSPRDTAPLPTAPFPARVPAAGPSCFTLSAARLVVDHVAIAPGMRHEQLKPVLTKFVLAQRPQLVVIGAGSAGMACRTQRNLMQEVLKDAMVEHERRNNDSDDDDYGRRGGGGGGGGELWEDAQVMLADDSVAAVFSRSVRGQKEFPEYADGLRLAIALGRGAQSPLAELAYMWQSAGARGMRGEETLALRLHALQGHVSKGRLIAALERVLVEATCAAGVELNHSSSNDHAAGLLSFVSGLGPRKAVVLRKKVVGGKRGYVESREDLFLRRVLAPTVFRNAASFLRFSAQRHGVLHNKVRARAGGWWWWCGDDVVGRLSFSRVETAARAVDGGGKREGRVHCGEPSIESRAARAVEGCPLPATRQTVRPVPRSARCFWWLHDGCCWCGCCCCGCCCCGCCCCCCWCWWCTCGATNQDLHPFDDSRIHPECYLHSLDGMLKVHERA